MLRCCPSVNDKLLKELARTEDGCGLPLSLKETIGVVLELSDSFIRGSFPPIGIWDVLVPSKLSSRKQQDIMEGQVGRLGIENMPERASFELNDNIVRVGSGSIAWENDCNLIGDIRNVISPGIGMRKIRQASLNVYCFGG